MTRRLIHETTKRNPLVNDGATVVLIRVNEMDGCVREAILEIPKVAMRLVCVNLASPH